MQKGIQIYWPQGQFDLKQYQNTIDTCWYIGFADSSTGSKYLSYQNI